MNNIPKIIHQIWIQGEDNIPSKFYENINTIKKMHPAWEYKLWDDIEIIKLLRQYKDYITTYYKLEFLHQKVDYARYIILYLFGGAYIDMDATTVKPLDSLIEKYSNYNLIVSECSSNALEKTISGISINNGVILSKKGSIVLNDILNYVSNNNYACSMYAFKASCINKTTGPYMFSKRVKNFIGTKEVIVLTNDYLEPCVFDQCKITENTYIKHMHQLSWCPPYTVKVAKFYSSNKYLVYVVMVIILLLLFSYLIRRFR